MCVCVCVCVRVCVLNHLKRVYFIPHLAMKT